ncbi:hypothetical protein WICMUC_005433 [Wickerhamomyces mucosus]|uniref:NAD-dependent epimerase/dehydratase domain-containing protein n=1 Tax=Wickerhamomyces mucosus TaxID=1378264 RepID=A0A9P8T6M8_9ASCO|nr:hypothetical protein WICMUC_005433 [Wickerhamomyces mucosus]
MSSKVLVSGATGYVALWIIGELLSKNYTIIGTVRSEDKKNQLLQKFNAKYGDKFNSSNLILEIVKDIGKSNAFDEIFIKYKDIKYVLHTASPFAYGLGDDLNKEYLEPARDGTLNVLKAIVNHAPQVEKVVITSSQAAVLNLDKLNDSKFIHTEKTWNPLEWKDVNNEFLAYFVSKKVAERAAWDFIRDNQVNFKLITILPPYIFGPQFFDSDASGKLGTSAQIIKDLLKSDPNDYHLFDDIKYASTDVRDIAKFHIFALEISKLSNERIAPVAERFNQQLILNIINDNLPKFNGYIAKGDYQHEKDIESAGFDVSKSVELVGGYKFISLKQQVLDSVNQIVEFDDEFAKFR